MYNNILAAEQCDSSNSCGANTECAVVNTNETCFCKAGYQFVPGSSTICEGMNITYRTL